MKKLLALKSVISMCLVVGVILFLQIACKREKALLTKQQDDIELKVAKIKNWWGTREKASISNQTQTLSRVPDGNHQYYIT